MQTLQFILSPKEAHEAEQKWRVVKRSVDARQRELKVHLTVLVDEKGKPISLTPSLSQGEGEWRRYEPPKYKDVHNAERQVVIIGAGPAGLFAALTLIEHGIKPIIYERGKEVSERKKDIALLNRNEGERRAQPRVELLFRRRRCRHFLRRQTLLPLQEKR